MWGNKLILVLMAAMVLATGVSAAWYVSLAGQDAQIEVYYGSEWAYSPQPYSYYYNNWYFFEEPYRYYYGGMWNYYEPGWYNFYPNWAYTPSAYGYYGPGYFYQNNVWSYSPGWYKDWRYYSYYDQVTNFPPHISDTVGGYIPYTYPQEASCGEVYMRSWDIDAERGDVGWGQTLVYNKSPKNFVIDNVRVYIEGMDNEVLNVKKPNYVPADGNAYIYYELSLGEEVKDALNGSVQISGEFTDFTDCTASDIGTSKFRVEFLGEAVAAVSPASVYGGPSYSRSISIIPLVEDLGSGAAEAVIGEVVPEGAGSAAFAAGTSTRLEEPRFYGNCQAVLVEVEDVYLKSGEAKEVDFYIKNLSAQDFYADDLELYDYSGSFTARLLADSAVVKAGKEVAVPVKISALPTNEKKEGSVFFAVKGEFESGWGCALDIEQSQVYIEKDLSVGCGDVKIEVPEEINTESGSFIVTIDNPRNTGIEIYMLDENVNVPGKIVVGAETYAEREIPFENAREPGKIIYKVVAQGCAIADLETDVNLTGVSPSIVLPPAFTIGNYAAVIDAVDGAKVRITVTNHSPYTETFGAYAKNLPNGVSILPVQKNVSPGQTETLELELDVASPSAGGYSTSIVVQGIDRVVELPLMIRSAGSAAPIEAAEVPESLPDQIGSMAATAFVVAGENAVNLGIVIIALILLYLIFRAARGSSAAASSSAGNSWVA